MLSRRITSTVIERCRDLLASAPRVDSSGSELDVPSALRVELNQLHKKMTSMLRQAETLENAQEQTLVLERKELQDLLGCIEVLTVATKATTKEPELPLGDFPNESWVRAAANEAGQESIRALGVERRKKLRRRVRTTTINAPYRISIEREMKPRTRSRSVRGISNPAALKVAERLLNDGLPYDRVAQKIGVSVSAVRELASQIEAEFHEKVRRSTKARTKRIAKQPSLRSTAHAPARGKTALATTNVAQGAHPYPGGNLPREVEQQLEDTLRQQAHALEAVASITLGRAEIERRDEVEVERVETQGHGSPFVRQQLLL